MAQYWTYNTAGGVSYNGHNLKKAIENALSHFGDGYIRSKNGKRPVIEIYDDSICDTYFAVGEFGESLDELEKRNQE